jgi:outer membrane protein insertion porin family
MLLRVCATVAIGPLLVLAAGRALGQPAPAQPDWRAPSGNQNPPIPPVPGAGGATLLPPQNAIPAPPAPGGVLLQPPQPAPPVAVPALQVAPPEQERPARVGQIIICGLTRTREDIVRREIPLRPGEILRYPLLREAERNLIRLNIFEVNPQTGVRPTVTVREPNPPSEFKDIIVTVQEAATTSLLFGVAVNSDAGLVGTVALNERNFDITRFPSTLDELINGTAFRGRAQEFRLEAMPGTEVQRYTATWRDPSVFDTPYSLAVSTYFFTRDYNEYDESRLGTRITVGRKLDPIWSVSGTLRLEDVGIHDVPVFEPAEIQSVVGNHFLGSVRAAVTRDTRDSYVRATEGSLVEASFEQFFGDFTFPQIVIEGSKYWTVYERPDGSGRHVLAGRSELGWSGSNTPVFERFYAGGFRSMRGFEFRGVGPDINGFKVGGDFLLLNSLEYQFPVLANDHLYGVVFVDSGTVESSVEIRNYRIAVGAGIRIFVPYLGPVPIALDLGFPIVKGPNDKEQVLSFWVGFFH